MKIHTSEKPLDKVGKVQIVQKNNISDEQVRYKIHVDYFKIQKLYICMLRM